MPGGVAACIYTRVAFLASVWHAVRFKNPKLYTTSCNVIRRRVNIIRRRVSAPRRVNMASQVYQKENYNTLNSVQYYDQIHTASLPFTTSYLDYTTVPTRV